MCTFVPSTQTIMKRKRLYIAILLAFLPFLIQAKGNKEQEEMIQLAAQIIQKGESAMVGAPGFLLNNDSAKLYCQDILYNSDEQYESDTAKANAIIRDLNWITGHMVFPDPKTRLKLLKKNLDPDKLPAIYDWSNRFLYDIQPRYSTLKKHCDTQLELRRTALQQVMPEGQLVRLSYEESGNHIPVHENYELCRDSVLNVWKLNGYEVPDSVPARVRILAEQNKTYQCLNRYLDVPASLSMPVEGGPPAYTFCLQFEGGTIKTGSGNKRPPRSCQEILDYLKSILRELCKTEQDQD